MESMDFETATKRLALGGEELPIEARFGSLEFQLWFWTCKSGKCTPPGREPTQGWLLPIYTAQGRFSVGLNAACLDEPTSYY